MKKLLIQTSFLTMILALVLWSCKKEDTNDPLVEGIAIDNYDLIQLTNDNPDVPVYVSFSDDRGIDSIQVNIYPLNSTTPIVRNVIRNFIHSSTGRTLVKTPFPYPAYGGVNGVYTVEYIITDKSGKTFKTSYNVNIVNNKIEQLCSFPTMNLPADKNTIIRVTTTQPLAANENIYITGSFEAANGGAGDWTGGSVDRFKLTRLPGSNQCFYIMLNLNNSQEFKFTLGDWGKEALDNTGGTPSNYKWNGQATQDFTIYNWKTKPLVIQNIPQVLPNAGIVTGKMSVIADVGSTNDDLKYYLVPKGGSLTDKSNPMYRVAGSTKVIGAVPKNTSVEYIVVRDNNGVVKKGVNAWGFEVTAKWDGMTNPVNISTPFFEGDAGILTPPANLYLVGSPNGWSNPPAANYKFVQVSPGKFELASVALKKNDEYLLLPVAGSWDQKYGGNGKLSGAIVPQGNNIPAPDVDGNYKITVDFTTGMRTLTKL